MQHGSVNRNSVSEDFFSYQGEFNSAINVLLACNHIYTAIIRVRTLIPFANGKISSKVKYNLSYANNNHVKKKLINF